MPSFRWPIDPAPDPKSIPKGYLYGSKRSTGPNPHLHSGLDLGVLGQTVYAAAPGIVRVAVPLSVYGGPGIVEINHGEEGGVYWQTRYLHLAPTFPVKSGQPVAAGEPIGKVGNITRDHHLHFEIVRCDSPGCVLCATNPACGTVYKLGTRLDPLPLLGAGGSLIAVATVAGALLWWFV